MSLRIPAPHWESVSGSQDAKCLKFPADPETKFDPWFDDMDESVHICNGTYDGIVCPIRHACLIFALVNNEHEGVFGGLRPEQRHWLRQTYRHTKHQPRPEWKFENAPSYESIREAQQAREAEREARRRRGDEEERHAAARRHPAVPARAHRRPQRPAGRRPSSQRDGQGRLVS